MLTVPTMMGEAEPMWESTFDADTILSLKVCLECIDAFREKLWPFLPIHPACLCKDNINYVCFGQGAQDTNALSLNVNIAIALGRQRVVDLIVIKMKRHYSPCI